MFSGCSSTSVCEGIRFPDGAGWLLTHWSYWHPFHLIRTLGPRVDETLKEIILLEEYGRDKLASGWVQEFLLCGTEEKGLAGSKGRPRHGRPHAETPSLPLTNTAVDNLSFGDSAQRCGVRRKGGPLCSPVEENWLMCGVYKHTLTHCVFLCGSIFSRLHCCLLCYRTYRDHVDG